MAASTFRVLLVGSVALEDDVNDVLDGAGFVPLNGRRNGGTFPGLV